MLKQLDKILDQEILEEFKTFPNYAGTERRKLLM